MARIRRLAALVGAVALSGAFVTGPARADSAEVYSGSAAGTALDLSVLGKQATFGVSAARANSAGVATARGAGWLSTTVDPLDDVVGAYQSNRLADAATANPDVKSRECVAPNLPAAITIPSFVNLGLVCGSAEASNQNGLQNAKAEGSIAELAVNAETQVPQAVSDLAIGDKLAGVLQPVCDALKTVSNVGCDAQTTVEDLVTSVLETKTLDVKVGTSNSSVTTTASTVTAHGDAAGAVIKILPLPQVNGLASTEPVVTITVGSAKATATYDRSTGKATPEADPAIVRIKFNTVLTNSLDVPGILPEIVIAPQTLVELGEQINRTLTAVDPTLATTLITVCEDGAAVCILNGTPLASKIWFAGKSTKTNPDGSVSAKATAVRAELLTALPELVSSEPGVVLGLAQAEAHVGGKPAQVTIQKQDDPGPQQVGELPRGEVPLELPRTGGFPILPMAGAGMLSLAVLLRRAVAKATR